MKKIYEREIIHLGDFLEESYEEGFIILFGEKANEDYKEYCAVHVGTDLEGDLKQGDILKLRNVDYKITAVGDVVNTNLAEFGHITLKFDGEVEAEKPGMLHLEKKEIVKLTIGDSILIYSL